MPSSTIPPNTLPFSTPLPDILSAFDTHGAIVLTSFLPSSTVSTLITELAPYNTALASKSPTFVKTLLTPKLLEILDARLSKSTKIWHGEERLTNKSRPQLSATVVFDLPSGREAEPLHRHDDIYFVDHPLSVAVEVWALWNLGTETLGEGSGAPDTVLASHLWGEEWDPKGHKVTSMTMPPGSCLLLHGSTIHRGGANSSLTTKRILGASWTQGHMRQEENQYLATSKEDAMKLDEETQRLIGYKINAPMGGWYELRDPLTFLKPDEEVDKTMRDFTEREGEEMPV